MKVAVFLTAEAAAASELLARVRAQHAGASICAFVRDDDRQALGSALSGCDVRRDKPDGGKVAFVRALRRERFDLLVAAWHGGERFQPLRLVALFAGARRLLVVDERGRQWAVRWYLPWTWSGHALRRLLQTKATTLVRAGAGLYRATFGAVVAVAGLLLFALRRRRRRGGDSGDAALRSSGFRP